MKDLHLGNLRRAVAAARDQARFFEGHGWPSGALCCAPPSTWRDRILARKWRRILHARHQQAVERIESLRAARKEEARFLVIDGAKFDPVPTRQAEERLRRPR